MRTGKLFLHIVKTLFVISSLPSMLMAQEILKNRLIVKGENLRWESSFTNNQREKSAFTYENLCQDLNLYLIESDTDFTINDIEVMKAKLGASEIFYDRKVLERKAPNDAFYDKQDYMSLIQIPKVWEVTTGGKMDNNEDIVIAILDNGIEITHPDLSNNIFKNPGEVLNDNIDNDLNGYVDDVAGINAATNLGVHIAAPHGTWVSGIVGAEGNNNMGVTGVNWNIKILPVSAVGNVATVIKGYDYALRMKKLYLQTNGAMGANIVVTNFSGGIEAVFGSEPTYKPWCDMYDLLGAQGILSVGSTANANLDVDLEGDMPSTCSSEFFIAVTSSNDQGLITRNVGYGTTNIDLAAPGEDIFNLNKGGAYFEDIGTSASAPLVAGTIALLYSVPCPTFVTLVKADKIKAARYVRDAIFKGVSPTIDLVSYVKYGGYLNAFNSLLNMQDACEGNLSIPIGNLNVESVTYKGGFMSIKYLTPKKGNHALGIYDAVGKIVRFFEFEVPAFGDNTFEVNNLDLPQGVYYVNIISDKANAAKPVFIW